MNFGFSEDQQTIKATARELLADRSPLARVREAAPRATAARRAAVAASCASSGWPGIAVPEEHGGQGLGAVELAVLLEELGYAVAATPVPRLASSPPRRSPTRATTRSARAGCPASPCGELAGAFGGPGARGGRARRRRAGARRRRRRRARCSRRADADVEPLATVDPTRAYGRVAGDGRAAARRRGRRAGPRRGGDRGRARRRLPARAGHDRRLRLRAAPVRRARRRVPGGRAPLRADAPAHGGRALGGLLRGLGGGRGARAARRGGRARPRGGRRTRRRRSRARRSRRTAASASPGRPTCTGCSSARSSTRRCSAAASRARIALARLVAAPPLRRTLGSRRHDRRHHLRRVRGRRQRDRPAGRRAARRPVPGSRDPGRGGRAPRRLRARRAASATSRSAPGSPGRCSRSARWARCSAARGPSPQVAGADEFCAATEQVAARAAASGGRGDPRARRRARARRRTRPRCTCGSPGRSTRASSRPWRWGRPTGRRRSGWREQTDRAREAYVQHFYRADARDPAHYHLVIDSTALPLPACAALVVGGAARSRPAAERDSTPAPWMTVPDRRGSPPAARMLAHPVGCGGARARPTARASWNQSSSARDSHGAGVAAADLDPDPRGAAQPALRRAASPGGRGGRCGSPVAEEPARRDRRGQLARLAGLRTSPCSAPP